MANTDSVSLFGQVRGILNKVPCKESLYELLKLASPTLTEEEMLEEHGRNAAMAKLIHDVSNSEPPSTERISTRLSDLQDFMDRCCEILDGKKATGKRKANPHSPPPPPTLDFPDKFHVHDKWPFLDIPTIQPHVASGIDNRVTGALAAIHCMNARGTIAHGRRVETPLRLEHVRDLSIEEAFDKIGGGVKHLTSVEAIKQELMKNGPVVSTSFVPRRVFPTANHPVALIKNKLYEKHPLLIVGWEHRGYVDCWLAKRLPDGSYDNDTEPMKIGIGRYGIDDACVAPIRSFEDMAWQNGNFFGVNHLPEGWMNSSQLGVRVSHANLELLVGCYDVLKEKPVVLRNKKKIAQSRRYLLKGMIFVEEMNLWILSFRQIE